MKKKVILIVAALIVIAAAVWWGTKTNSQFIIHNSESETETTVSETVAEPTAALPAEPTAEQTAKPEDAETEEGKAEEREQPFLVQVTQDDPSIAYVLVRLPNTSGLLPLPTEGEYTRTIRQTAEDGTEAVNVVHLTANGFWMEDANCEGHDCVKEGEVTLENREERVLWNMVICLPHQLSLELITREEAVNMLAR